MNTSNHLLRVFSGLFILLFIFLLAWPSHAQIVNVETKRLRADTTGWYGNLDLTANFVKNTRELWSFGTNFNILHIKTRHAFLFIADLKFDKAADVDLINKGYQHFRYNYKLIKDKRWFLELFEQVQFDAIRQIDKRFLFGAGLRNRLAQTEKLFINLGLSFMYEEEKLKGEDNLIDEPRLNCYGNIQWHITKNAFFSSTFYYQPRMKDFSYYRLASNSKITIEFSNHFAFKIEFEINYDNSLQADIPELVYSLKNGLSYKF